MHVRTHTHTHARTHPHTNTTYIHKHTCIHTYIHVLQQRIGEGLTFKVCLYVYTVYSNDIALYITKSAGATLVTNQISATLFHKAMNIQTVVYYILAVKQDATFVLIRPDCSFLRTSNINLCIYVISY